MHDTGKILPQTHRIQHREYHPPGRNTGYEAQNHIVQGLNRDRLVRPFGLDQQRSLIRKSEAQREGEIRPHGHLKTRINHCGYFTEGGQMDL